MTSASARPLREVVGEGVRRVREAADLRQADVAQAAREHGLTWSRPKVAELERGEKAVGVEELALLPRILAAAFGRPVALGNLIDQDAVIRLSPTVVVTGRDLLGILGESAADTVAPAVTVTPEASPPAPTEAETTAARKLGITSAEMVELSQKLWGRSLDAERNAIVDERHGDGISADRRRALRGQVTRELVDQINRSPR